MPGRSERVGAVLDHRETVTPRGGEDRIHVARQPVEVRRDHGARARCDRLLERVGIERERPGVDVGEYRSQSGDPGHLRNHPEREGRKHDLRSAREIERSKQVIERHPSVGGRDGIGGAEARRERMLERGEVRPPDQLPLCPERVNRLLRVRDHPGAVPRDRSQHATGLDIAALSSRPWRADTRSSSRASSDGRVRRIRR